MGVSLGCDGLMFVQVVFVDLWQWCNFEIEIGWIFVYKLGDEGILLYCVQQVLIYMQMLVCYDGYVFVQIDIVYFDLGMFDMSNLDVYLLKMFGIYVVFCV